MKQSDDHLHEYYLNTDYVVCMGGQEYHIRVNQVPVKLQLLMEDMGWSEALFISADNPGSERLSDQENQSRYEQLKKKLTLMGCEMWYAEGRPLSGDWPIESNVFVPDIPKEDAEELAYSFGQYAYLWIVTKGSVSLCYTGILQSEIEKRDLWW
ncbi:MAG: DUF3293 domain-containing protein [Fibrobacterales bacterium]